MDRDIDFCINLESCTRPISIPTYHTTLTKLRELTTQLQEFLDKRFVHPSAWPWGCSSVTCEKEGR